MHRWYKTVAEEAAYSYQAKEWSLLVRLLMERGDVEAFMRGLDENLRRHQSDYCILERDLREQIKEAVAKVMVEADAWFLHANTGLLVEGRAFLPPDSIKRLLGWLFDGGGGEGWRREMAAKRERGTVGSRPEFKSRGEESFGSKSTLRSLCDEINSFVFIFLHRLSGGHRARCERSDRSPSTIITHQFFPLAAQRRRVIGPEGPRWRRHPGLTGLESDSASRRRRRWWGRLWRRRSP